MTQHISEQQWRHFDEEGYVRLGKIVDDETLTALSGRIDEIMLGTARVDYDRMTMQEDNGHVPYEQIAPMTKGQKGSHLNYRKIEQLEFDPRFLAYLQWPVFREASARIYGAERSIRVMRAMFFNKPARGGSVLPWHQDMWTAIKPDPRLTVWLALDPSKRENGCVQIIPGSHRRGPINPNQGAGFLTKEMVVEHCSVEDVEHLEMEAGEVTLLDNYLLHSSEINRSDTPRRAFSVCYMDADSTDSNGTEYSTVFGEGALNPATLPIPA